jgi:hypothetical protein
MEMTNLEENAGETAAFHSHSLSLIKGRVKNTAIGAHTSGTCTRRTTERHSLWRLKRPTRLLLQTGRVN